MGPFECLADMSERSEWLTWSLAGLEVTQLRFDYQFHVHVWSPDRDLLVSFGAPFTLRPPEGEPHTFDPERNESLGPLLSLLHLPVTQFAASSGGECALLFGGGAELRGAPHERYEAWESHGKGDLASASLLCGVGGGSPWE